MELPNREIDEGRIQEVAALRSAQLRIIWYLNALQVQPEKSLFYAGKAMEQACRNGLRPDPQSAAMRCLHHVLWSYGIPDRNVLVLNCLQDCESFQSAARRQQIGNMLRSSLFPTIKRGLMPAAELELKPWKRPSIALWRSLSQFFMKVYYTQYSRLFFVVLLILFLCIGL